MNNAWQLLRIPTCTKIWDVDALETVSVVMQEAFFWVVFLKGTRSGAPFPTREEAEEYALVMLRIMS